MFLLPLTNTERNDIIFFQIQRFLVPGPSSSGECQRESTVTCCILLYTGNYRKKNISGYKNECKIAPNSSDAYLFCGIQINRLIL